MTALATFLCLTPVVLALASLIALQKDRPWLVKLSLAGWIGCSLLLVVVHDTFPFAGGGDDEGYFFLAGTPIETFADAFDLTRFAHQVAQPGYPWVLSLLHHFGGQDLLSLKLLNVACFITLIGVWYRIGTELEGKDFGRASAIVILFLTPLWYSWMFLLKDIIIVLLQSVFLLGVVQVRRRRSIMNWLLVLASTLALIPFRATLVSLNIATVAGATALMFAARQQWKRHVWSLIFLIAVTGTALWVASNPETMAALGVFDKARVLGIESVRETLIGYDEQVTTRNALFPLLYLFSETAGFNPQTFTDFDAFGLRGVLATPWILVVVPFFLLGLVSLTRRDLRVVEERGVTARFSIMRLTTTPWGALLVFILSYMWVSWTVGDTTRWRLADMPVMATVAVAGWWSTAPRRRVPYLVMFFCVDALSFSLYYLTKNN